jgi:hypothetical protein
VLLHEGAVAIPCSIPYAAFAYDAPESVRGDAEAMLHDASDNLVTYDGAAAWIDNSCQTQQQHRQSATATQQMQPLAAKEALALQRRERGRALGQHSTEKRRVVGAQQNVQRQAAAADDEKSGRSVQQR